MAGKGFNIDELLREKELGLNLPPFLQNQAQFSAANVLEKKNYCKGQSTFRKSHPKNKGIPFFLILMSPYPPLALSISST